MIRNVPVRAIELREVPTSFGTRWVVESYEDGRVVARTAFFTREYAEIYARTISVWTVVDPRANAPKVSVGRTGVA